MRLDEIQHDYAHNIVKIKEKVIQLTPREMDIFELIHSKNGKPLPVDNIISNIYNLDEPPYAYRSVLVHIHHINKKITPYGFQVCSIYGRGYKLADMSEINYRIRKAPEA